MIILFSRDRGVFSALIRVATWSDWSHVDVVDGDHLIGALASGVARYPAAERISVSTATARMEVPLTAEQHRLALRFLAEQLGKPYDWAGIFGMPLRRDWQQDDAWFCSELVAAACAFAGRPVTRRESGRVTPQDLYESMLLEAKRR
jgi:uncharacterized protein YycO